VRCPRCGNENSDTNRFCGMCGATLLPESAPAASGPAQGAPTRTSAAPSSLPSAPAQSRTSAPVSEESTVISGPSFLGLNDPAPRKRAGLSADPHASSSRNLDYLLDDEEEHRHGGGKFILILLALALAVGFGYLRWKNQGFGWLGSHTNKPSAAAQSSDAPDTSSATPPASNSSSSPATPTAPPQPAPDPAAAAGSPAATSPAATNPAAGSPAAASSATNPATATTPNSAPGDAGTSSDTSNPPADSAAVPPPMSAAKEPAPAVPDATPAANPKPNKAADQPPSKPHAAIKPTQAIDSVSEAQKYLYGRGVTQDCERGLRLLKPAANQSNPKAMIEMGALYSAGLCTPHDLPTAYRWFALALRKDPNNMAVQTDLQKLWGEMTQPERQLAIKLSQ
jgi:hypothetical protein